MRTQSESNPNRWLSWLCWLSVAAVPTLVVAQSGPTNGEFDNDLSGWTFDDPPMPAWSPLDDQGNPDSGSVELSNNAVEAGVRVYPLFQCFAVAPGAYVIEASGRLESAQPAARLVISYAYYSNDECSGGHHDAGGYFLESVGAWGGITSHYVLTLGVLGVPGYLGISLGIEKDPAGGIAVGNIDGVRLISVEQIFADGFEVD